MLDLKKNTVAEWMLKEGYTEVTLMDFYRDIYPEEVLRADNKGSAKPFFKDLSGLKMAIDKSNETYGLLEAAGAPPDRQDFRGLSNMFKQMRSVYMARTNTVREPLLPSPTYITCSGHGVHL